MGRFSCPSCGQTINLFALTQRLRSPRRLVSFTQTLCPKCDAPIRQRVRFLVFGSVALAVWFLLGGLVLHLVDPPAQFTALIAALLAWWVLVLAWWFSSPWIADNVESNP